jgi:WD40 repeat protein
MSISTTNFYITGGTLQRDAACYVERQADSTLFDGLMQGRFCYVLTSRQMGKSSLMVRTAVRLREEGVAVAVLDLTAIGQNLNPEQWYNGLLNQLGQRLDLEDELEDFAYEHKQLSPLQRWMRAIRELVLDRCSGRVVIFLDEIDAVRSLPFSTDEFFAGIRELYNGRTEDAELERLTFCLLGVATPSDLIRDTRTTPFNIGQRIELNDFASAEAALLARGLMREERLAEELLKRILYWTGGHPYLTQRLCRAVAEDNNVKNAAGIDRLCEEIFFSHRAQERDDNLLFVRERILRGEVDIAGLLGLYGRVRRGRRVQDDVTSRLVSILRLSGIVRVENSSLKVRNRIYQRVFDGEWVKVNMPDAELRRQRRIFWRALLGTTAVAGIIITLMSYLAFTSIDKSNRYRRLLYAANMSLAQRAFERSERARVMELLEDEYPKPGEEDLRSFEWYYLWRLCNVSQTALKHKSEITSVAFSPNGKILAYGTRSGDVKLWSVVLDQELFVLAGHRMVRCLAFSPDGKLLAAGSNDATIQIWDIASKQEIFTLNGGMNQFSSLAFSPDSRTLAAGNDDSTLRLFDIEAKQEIAILKGHKGLVSSLTFSPDGRILISCGYDKTVRLWDTVAKQEVAVLKGHSEAINAVAISPDGKTLATGSLDKTAKLWDINRREELVTLEIFRSSVTSLAFSPDSGVLALGSNGLIKLWDVVKREEVTSFEGHTFMISSLMFSLDGKLLASAGYDGTIRLWNLTAKRESFISLVGHSGKITSVAFSPDGRILATGSSDKTVKLWDTETKGELATLRGHTDEVWSVAFSPDGRVLATGSPDRTVRFWDVATKRELSLLTGNIGSLVRDVKFSPDGKTLILYTGTYNNTVRLWDIATKQELPLLSGRMSALTSMALSVDGKRLATYGMSSELKIWNLATGEELNSLSGEIWTFSLAFSKDGKKLGALNNNDKMKLWELPDLEEVAVFKVSDAATMTFSPDNRRLVTGGLDSIIRIWDVATSQELASFKGNRGSINSLTFSPDGKILATGNEDGTVDLWLAATEEEVQVKSR